MADRLRIAVVGSGVAGLTAAYILRRSHDVTLIEKNDRLGGHAHTHDIAVAGGRTIPLDTGFIVHNERTYPFLLRLFRELGVQTQDSSMSFGVSCRECGLEYSGARGLRILAPSVGRAALGQYARMVLEIARFHRHGQSVLRSKAGNDLALGDFLDSGGYSPYFRHHFLLPLSGAVWSSPPGRMLTFPARYLLRFFANHGLLSVGAVPQWKTVVGGSRTYVERIGSLLGDGVKMGSPAASISRDPAGVTVTTHDGRDRRFDRVVIAAHPDQALGMLAQPSEEEQRILGAFVYTTNETVLHTDRTLLPRTHRARSSWNYLHDACGGQTGVANVTYSLNRLQALHEPLDYCVTLNQTARIDPAHEIARMTYEHPVYTRATLDAQHQLPGLNGREHTHYCGAYQGWGFHEDGCASGVRAAAAIGATW